MNTVSYTRARENLAKTMDQVVDNHEPIIITRQKGQAVVLMSLDDFNAYEETAYLPNAARLLKAVEEAKQGKHTARELIAET